MVRGRVRNGREFVVKGGKAGKGGERHKLQSCLMNCQYLYLQNKCCHAHVPQKLPKKLPKKLPQKLPQKFTENSKKL